MSGVRRLSTDQLKDIFLGVPAALICALLFMAMSHFWSLRYEYPRFLKQTRRRLEILRGQIDSYRIFHGALPKSLCDLSIPLPEVIIPDRAQFRAHFGGYAFDGFFDEEGRPLDPWGFPYRYRATNRKFELCSTGADGQIRGVGVDADLSIDDPPDAVNQPTLAQLLWEHDAVRFWRLIEFSILVWGGIMFALYVLMMFGARATFLRDDRIVPFTQSLLALVLVTVVMTWLMAWLFAAQMNQPPARPPIV